MIIQKIDLSLSENLRLAPVYNKKWIKYQRTERNGYVSLMIPAGRYPRYEVLNATTINILVCAVSFKFTHMGYFSFMKRNQF